MPTLKREDGQSLYFEDGGGPGPAVVLGHGFLMDQTMFDPISAALGDRFRIIRWDARGFGRSGWNGRPHDPWRHADDIAALMDHLGLSRAFVGGMSQGGYSALRFTLRHPDRVLGLILLSTMAGPTPPEAIAFYRDNIRTMREQGMVEPLLEGTATALLGDRAHWEPWLTRWRAYDPHHVAGAMEALIARDDVSGRLGEVTAPTFIAHGTEDHGMPIAAAEFLAAKLPADGVVRLEGGAHAAAFTHADALVEPLRAFLDQHQHGYV
ncbi:MAG: alpha/beta hydrolase [Myxococcota bacterium]